MMRPKRRNIRLDNPNDTKHRIALARGAGLVVLILGLITGCANLSAVSPTTVLVSTLTPTITQTLSPSLTATHTPTIEATPAKPTVTPIIVRRLTDLGVVVYLNNVPFFIPYEGTTPIDAVAAMCYEEGDSSIEDPIVLEDLTDQWLTQNDVNTITPGTFYKAMVVGKDSRCEPSNPPDMPPTVSIDDVYLDSPGQSIASIVLRLFDLPDSDNYVGRVLLSNKDGEIRENSDGTPIVIKDEHQIIAPNGDFNVYKLGIDINEIGQMSSDEIAQQVRLAFQQEFEINLSGLGLGTHYYFIYEITDKDGGVVQVPFAVIKPALPTSTSQPPPDNGKDPGKTEPPGTDPTPWIPPTPKPTDGT